MDKKQYNSLAQIAQEIANRYGAKNMGHTDIMNNREVWFYRKPHRDNTTRTILTYDEIKEHFGFDVEEDHRRKEATRNSNVESVSSSNSEQNSAEKAEDEEMAEENIFEKLNKLFEELTRRYGRGIFGKQIEELKEKVDKLSKNPNETSIETAEFIYDDLKDLVSENYLSNLTKEKLAEKKAKGEEFIARMEEETQFIQDFFNQETYTIVWEPSENTKKAHEYRDNKQFDKALELYTKEAENGDAEAQYCLGFMYEFNKHFGIPNDKSNYAKSMFWYKTSADNHHYGAQLEYGKKCIVASHGDINQINEGLNYLAKAADSNATKRMEAMSEYIDTVISRKTGKETIIKAIEYCDKIADTPKVSFEKEQALKKKAILEEQLKNIQPAKKQKTNRTNGCRGCLVAVLVAIIGLVIIAIVINSANKALGNKSALSTQETVSTVAFGEEMIELHNIDPVEQQQITMKSTNGYTVDDTLWDGAFVYRAGSWEDTAYAIYDIGGHFEKIEFEATPWLGERHFFENSTADIMIINAETNDIIHTETINYNSGIITVEADITGVNKLGIHVKETNGYFAYTFIRNVYIYPVGTAEETSDSYKITGNIRSGAGMDYDIILASDGSTVYVATGNKVVISEDSEWYEVYIDEEKTTTGWCHSSIAEKQ